MSYKCDGLLGPLFLNCPLPWGTNYPYTICCGLVLINGLKALISILPLTLGPYPTQFVDGPLGPLIYFGNAPISGPYLNKDHELVWYCCVLTHKSSKSYIVVVVVLSVETNGYPPYLFNV